MVVPAKSYRWGRESPQLMNSPQPRENPKAGESGTESTEKGQVTKKILSVEVPALEKENRTERREGRTLALQALYAFESHRQHSGELNPNDFCRFEWRKKLKPASATFAAELVRGTISFLEEIDAIIKPKLKGWEFDRVSLANKSILRLSIYQLLHQKDIPRAVVINEAVDLAKAFGEDEDFKFINALLDRV